MTSVPYQTVYADVENSLAALEAGFDRLSLAAKNAGDLLHQAGITDCP